MNNCIFCKIVAGETATPLIFEDSQVVVFQDIRPKARVHLLVVSKEHIPSLAHTNAQHSALMGHIMLLLPQLAKEQGLTEGFRTIINTGAGGGQEIDHLHVHLLGGGSLPKM